MDFKLDSINYLSDLLPFLTAVDRGHAPTEEELLQLSQITKLSCHFREQINALPHSIKLLTNLRELSFFGAWVEDITPLMQLPNLEKLSLSGAQIADLSQLGLFTQLKSLDLFGTQILDIEPLTRLSKLQILSLSSSRVEDLTPLAQLSELRKLSINGTRVSDLSPLAQLKKLEILSLSGTQVTDITPLTHLKLLQHLSLSDTPVTDLTPLVQLPKLKSLDLSRTQITDLGVIKQFPGLQSLDLSDVSVTDFAGLADLPCLQVLSLCNTAIADLSPLEHLTNLQRLYLADTGVSDLSPLAGLTNLQLLYLARIPATDFGALKQLSGLKKLDLSRTAITDLGPLSLLSNLDVLDLSCTHATDISPLRGLMKLKTLDLSYMPKLHSIPSWFGGFQQLQELRLSGLTLDALPREMLALNTEFSNDPWEDGIHLKGTTLSKQPVSIFFQPREFIQEYFDAPKVDVNEAKVIFLGDGTVGKSRTIRRIKNGGKMGDYPTQTTHGIEITSYPAKKLNGEDFTINFWDFGGQDIMHAMHRCFLTDRTCYVVVISNRVDLNRQARYWLKNIASFTNNAPVLLAINRWDNIQDSGVNMSALLQDYPNLVSQPVYYSAKDSQEEDFNVLTRSVIRQAEMLDSTSLQFPAQWEAIRQDILVFAREHNYMDKEQYHAICQNHGLQSPEIRRWLLEWFNDLGVCFSYHQDDEEERKSYKVLNPTWLTNAIYILINSGHDHADKGKLNTNTMMLLLANSKYGVLPGAAYTDEERDYILEIMRKFNLSYPVSATQEFIPALCDSNTPKDLHPSVAEYPHHISYQMTYPYLPDNVIHQLMIHFYSYLHEDKLWRKGMRIDDRLNGLCAVVDMENDDATLRIDVYSTGNEEPWKLLNNLRSQIKKINSNLGITAEDWIIIREPDCEIPKTVNELLDAKDQGVSILPVYNPVSRRYVQRNVEEILGMTLGKPVVDTVMKTAVESQIPPSQAYYIYKPENVVIGAMHNTENHSSDEVLRLIEKLIDNQADQNKALLDKLTEALNDTGDPSAKTLAAEMEQDFKNGKKNFLQKILDYLKPANEIVGNTKTIAENLPKVMKAILTVLKTVEIAAQVIF